MKGKKPTLRLVGGATITGRTPPPPGGLCDHGAAEWRRVAPILKARGHLSDDVLATLEGYCRAVGLCRTYTARMDEDGHLLVTEKGLVSHPAFKMLTAVTREARLFAAELGLTPHRRSGAPEEGKGDGWDADLLA